MNLLDERFLNLVMVAVNLKCSKHATMSLSMVGGVTWFLGSLKISPFVERRLKDTQNPKCEDRRFQNCLVLKTEELATKPIEPED